MRRAWLLAAMTVAIVACEEDDAPLDAGPGPDGGEAPCELHVELGALDGDGTRARPFGELAAALAVASAGQVICLGPGEHPGPGTPIRGDVVLRGQSSIISPTSSAVGSGSCTTVDLLTEQRAPATDRVATAAALLAEGASLRLESLVVRGCLVGVAGLDAAVELNDVRAVGVATAIHVEGGSLTVADSVLEPRLPLEPLPDGPVGAAVFARDAEVTIRASELSVGSAVVGVEAFESNVRMEATTLDRPVVGIYASSTVAPTSVSLTNGTRIANQRSLDGAAVPRSVLSGVEATIDGLTIEGSEGVGLALIRGTSGALRDVDIEAEDGLLIFGADATMAGTNRVAATNRGMAVAASGGVAGSLLVEGSVLSEGAPVAHLVVALGGGPETGSIRVEGALEMTGGSLGVVSYGATATIEVPGSLRGREQSVAAIAARGGTIDIGAADLANAGVALLASGTGRIVTDGATIANVDIGGAALESGGLTLANTTISAARANGLLLSGAPSSVSGGRIEGAAEAGILATSDAEIDGTTIASSGGPGVEAQSGAEVTVANAAFQANTSAAVVFRDASGSVTGSDFLGTLPGTNGRADEILLEGAGTTREVVVGSNGFLLTEPRTCSDVCTVLMASGPGAVGIVMPNCLRESTEEASTRTVVDQDGGSLMLDAGLVWTGLLAGPASDLGLAIGTSSPIPSPSLGVDVSDIPAGLASPP